ncbi:MAG: leucine-rich repeat protein, partial [Clostridia bacterium]|nr:leucine-rich repeat protein [Clostridia bacterium]
MSSNVKQEYNDIYYSEAVSTANSAINSTIGNVLDSSTEVGSIAVPIINGLMESNVTLYNRAGTGALNDVWIRLYNDFTKTVVDLIPVITILVEEVLSPIILNAEGDQYYQTLDFILENLGLSLLVKNSSTGYYEIANASFGATDSSIDLNKTIPAILAYCTGDVNKARAYCGTYGSFLESKGIDINECEEHNIDANTIMLTGFYRIDFTFQQNDFDNLFGTVENDDFAGILKNLMQCTLEATEEYIAKSGKGDYRYSIDYSGPCTTTQRGLNNIAVAIPKLIDIIGNKFVKKYDANTEWTCLFDGEFFTKEKTYPVNSSSEKKTVNQYYNSPLEELRSYAIWQDNYDKTLSWIANRLNYYIGKANEITDVLVDNSALQNDDGVLYDNSKSLLINCKSNSGKFTVPTTVKEIFPLSFAMNKNIKEITIPHSVGQIGYYAFWGCDNLTDINYYGTEEEWKFFGCYLPENVAVHFYSVSHNHTYSDWKYNNDAEYNSKTDYTDGTATRTCTECGEVETKTIAGTGLLRANSVSVTLDSSVVLNIGIDKSRTAPFIFTYFKVKTGDDSYTLSTPVRTTTDRTYYDFDKISPDKFADEVTITPYGVT